MMSLDHHVYHGPETRFWGVLRYRYTFLNMALEIFMISWDPGGVEKRPVMLKSCTRASGVKHPSAILPRRTVGDARLQATELAIKAKRPTIETLYEGVHLKVYIL